MIKSKVGDGDKEASLSYTNFLPQSGRLFSDTWEVEVDVTDSIRVYENGKVWTCPCGAGAGTAKRKLKVKCYSCKDFVLVDSEALDRENQEPEPAVDEEEESAQGLGNWM